MLNFLKNFRGVDFDLLSVKANRFAGYGLALCSIKYMRASGQHCATNSTARCLAFVHFSEHHYNLGVRRKIYAGLLFFSFKAAEWQAVPEVPTCGHCRALCTDEKLTVDGYPNVYCSESCRSYSVYL